jgi:hypothetical protein
VAISATIQKGAAGIWAYTWNGMEERTRELTYKVLIFHGESRCSTSTSRM